MLVKPLNWKHRGRRADDWFADCPLGQYCVGDIHGVPMALLRRIKDGQMDDIEVGRYISIENAKKGAQRHFHRAVLALIEL